MARAAALALLALLAGPLGAGEAPAAGSADADVLEEVSITGSRIVRDGFQAPTPLTVMTTEDIQASGAKDISEFVNDIPAVVGSWDLQARTRQISNGTAGLTSPALRNLQPFRTLVLLNGQRSVPSAQTGEVDTANFPQMLISRVEVVTGGASSVYGSDALAGVINFILDERFTGFKTELSGGITHYGDGRNGKLQFAWGTPFAGGRGHALLSGEWYESEGVLGNADYSPVKREWHNNPDVRMQNPAYTATNGRPFFIVLPDAGNPRAIKNGALIYSGPLSGTAFDRNGTPFQFNYGIVNANQMSGGDWHLSDVSGGSSMDPLMRRRGVFTRLSYDLTDQVTAYTQLAWNTSYSLASFCHCYEKINITINVNDNPFLPQSVRQRAQALGVTSFQMGQEVDGATLDSGADRRVNRYLGGLEGSFNALGDEWRWDAWFQHGVSHSDQFIENDPIRPNLTAALDAVINPATGTIVCRVKLTNPASPCQPFNPFGAGVNSQAAMEYSVLDDAWRTEKYVQNVAGASLTGEPFALWAGPVSVALGAEYRKETLTGEVDEWSAILERDSNNFQATSGTFNVTEGFLETVIPLVNGKSWTRSLELNGAGRWTHYSTSGNVTTWKVGLSWTPLDAIRIRATQSRDIRAPNIFELFAVGGGVTGNVDDRFTGTNVRVFNIIKGNPDLKPEEADTLGIGLILSPGFAPGLSASIDYFKIDMKGAIGTVGGQEVVDNCFLGRTVFCSGFVRDQAGTLLSVSQQPFNFLKQVNRGMDYEVAYRFGLASLRSSWRGALNLRWAASNFRELYIDRGSGTPPLNVAGVNSTSFSNYNTPSWRHRFSINYAGDPVDFSLAARVLSDGKVDASWIECDSGCPTATLDNRTIEVGGNHVAGYVYWDTAASYRFGLGSGAERNGEIFVSVRNLFNRDPVRVPAAGTQGVRGVRVTYDGVYDQLGRQYQAGVRFSF